MKISGIVWLEDVVDKLQRKHRVLPEEVEEVLSGNPKVRKIEAGRFEGEDLFAGLGRSDGGRRLIVFFIYKATHEALIVSARDMTSKESKLYGQK